MVVKVLNVLGVFFILIFVSACSSEDEATKKFREFRKDANFRLPASAMVVDYVELESMEGAKKIRASVQVDEGQVGELGVSLNVEISGDERMVIKDSMGRVADEWKITVSKGDSVMGRVMIFFQAEQSMN